MKHSALADLPEISPDAEALARLAAYRDLLARWSARINLVADRDPAVIETRHIRDSLQLPSLLPPEGPIADLGSGGGLPGLVIAIMHPQRDIHLVESDRRKSAFLIDAAARLGLRQVRVHPTRIENAAPLLPNHLAAVTARALAPLDTLLAHAHALLPADGTGVAVFPKGRMAEQELTAAIPHWHMSVERFRSKTDADSTIFRISEIRRRATQ